MLIQQEKTTTQGLTEEATNQRLTTIDGSNHQQSQLRNNA